MTLSPSVLAISPTLRRMQSSAAGSDITTASTEWSRRPAEERYWSLADAAAAARDLDARRTLADLTPAVATIESRDGAPALVHRRTGNAARLSPLAADQIARLGGAPAGYLAGLPGDLAAACLRHGWESRADTTIRAQILDAGTSAVRVHAITSTAHDLTPNSLLLSRLANSANSGTGWRTPPARVPAGYQGETRTATAADVLDHAGHPDLSVRVGDLMAPSGTYLSDRDCFALLVDDSPRGQLDAGDHDQMSRFLMVSNSEVGTGALEVTTGWLRSVCGNHILWGCSDIINIRAIHKGSSATRSVGRLADQIVARNWTDDRRETAAKIAAARMLALAPSKEKLIDLLFSKKITGLKNAEIVADVAEELSAIDGDPRSAWGVAQSITRLSQISKYASDRAQLDRAAAKVLAMVN